MLKKRIHKYIILMLIILQPVIVLGQVVVSFSDTSAMNGTVILIPVIVSDLTNKGVRSFEFTVSFDKKILKCKGIEAEESLSDAFTWNTSENISRGKVKVKANGFFPLRGSGTLIYLEFKVVNESGGTELHWDSFMFNDGTPAVNWENGKFSVYRESQLTITNIENGKGFISVNDLEYELPYEQILEQGKDYKLQAFPDESSTFSGWSGDVSSKQNPYSITLQNDTDIKIGFELKQFEITTSVMPEFSGSVIGSGSYYYGEIVELITEPNDNWVFSEWTLDGESVSNDSILVLSITDEQHYTAKFINNLSSVETTSEPIDGGITTGGGYYYIGQTTTLTAVPNDGWRFSHWTVDGDSLSSDIKIDIEINGSLNYQANFERLLFTVTIVSSPIDGGNTAGGGFYFYDRDIDITASSNEGWKFEKWTENDTTVSSDSSYSINIKENRTLVANYTVLTNVEKENNIPALNFVSQPFPNPFNPSTVFRFGIANPSTVSLSIFDVSGKLVANIIDSELYQAGIYNKMFSISDISQISSGVYFFRFYSAESYSNKVTLETGKLLLLK